MSLFFDEEEIDPIFADDDIFADSEEEIKLWGITKGVRNWFDTEPPPMEWIVQDLIPARAITLLDALGGAGKSILAMQIALSVAAGLPFLCQKFQTSKSRVLLLNAEDDEAEMHRRYRHIIRAWAQEGVQSENEAYQAADNITAISIPSISVMPRLMDKQGQPTQTFLDIKAFCEKWQPSLIILDPLICFYGGDENSSSDAAQFYAMLKKLNTAILITHHQNKEGQRNNGNTTIAARGSIVFREQARSRLMLRGEHLIVEKANYSKKQDIKIVFHNRVFWSAGEADVDTDQKQAEPPASAHRRCGNARFKNKQKEVVEDEDIW